MGQSASKRRAAEEASVKEWCAYKRNRTKTCIRRIKTNSNIRSVVEACGTEDMNSHPSFYVGKSPAELRKIMIRGARENQKFQEQEAVCLTGNNRRRAMNRNRAQEAERLRAVQINNRLKQEALRQRRLNVRVKKAFA